MKCDIIIPVWNQLNFTRDCIENIVKNTQYPYRLILIDNASDNDTQLYLSSLRQRKTLEMELIRNKKNLGFVKAVNQGLNISKAPYVCILNNDTMPAQSWLKKMVEFILDHPDVGLVNPQCDGHGNMAIETYAKNIEKDRGKYMEMNQCQGFCMLIKRELIDKIGSLDEAFGIGGFDDTDYSMRAHIAGYRCVAIKDAYVYHRLHGSFDKAGNREEWVKRNQKIYYDKWGKHLHIALALTLATSDLEKIANLLMLCYGLAREWSWVYLWINCTGDKNAIKKSVETILAEKNLPPHQNIRIDYLKLPRPLFKAMIIVRLAERLRKRMADKRFDAVIVSEEIGTGVVLPHFTRITRTTIMKALLGRPEHDWQTKGKELALQLKALKKNNETRTL